MIAADSTRMSHVSHATYLPRHVLPLIDLLLPHIVDKQLYAALSLAALLCLIGCDERRGGLFSAMPAGYIGEDGRVCDLTPGLAPPVGYRLDTLGTLPTNDLNYRKLRFVRPDRAYLLSLRLASSGRTVVSRTDDGGRTWRELPVSHRTDPLGMACYGRDTCVVSVTQWEGTRGYRTFDGGASWEALPFEGPVNDLVSLFYMATGQLFAVSGQFGGRVVRSNDQGTSWRPVGDRTDIRQLYPVPGFDSLFYAVSTSNDFIALDTAGTLLYRWPVPVFQNGTILGLQVIDRDHVVARGVSTLHISSDGGRQWTKIPERVEGFVGFETPARGIIVTREKLCTDYDVSLTRDVFAVTTDGGDSWAKPDTLSTHLGSDLSHCQSMGSGEWRCILRDRLIALRPR